MSAKMPTPMECMSCSDPGRHQRVCPMQYKKLNEPRRDLCRPNQRCGGDGLERIRRESSRRRYRLVGNEREDDSNQDQKLAGG